MWISLISPLATIVIGWRQRFTLLWLYAITGLIVDNLSVALRENGFNQHWLGNIFVLAELILISFYYRQFIYKNTIAFYTVTALLTAGFIVHSVVNSVYVMNFLGTSVLCAIYVLYGVVGYLSLLRNSKIISLGNSPFFWINTAMFLYGSATCILFLFVTYLKSESFDLLMKVWLNFFTLINILHYIFIGIGLHKMPRREA